jgi:hypothetical protein
MELPGNIPALWRLRRKVVKPNPNRPNTAGFPVLSTGSVWNLKDSIIYRADFNYRKFWRSNSGAPYFAEEISLPESLEQGFFSS